MNSSLPGSAPRSRSRLRIILWTIAFIAAAMIVCVLLTAVYIARNVGDEARPADAIVVLGAAEYAGRPSPTFKARLDHGFDLYQRGIAPVVSHASYLINLATTFPVLREQSIAAFVDELDLVGLSFEGASPASTGRPSYHLLATE